MDLYRLSLERGRLDPLTAAIRLGVPAADTEAAMRDLTEVHLLRVEHGTVQDAASGPSDGPADSPADGCVLEYAPSSPDMAAAHLTGPINSEIQKLNRDAERLTNHVMSMKAIFEDSWHGHVMQTPIEYLTTLDAIRTTLERLTASARVEIATAHPRLPPPDTLEEGLARTTDALDRGVLLQTLYPHSVLAHQYIQQHLTTMTSLGAQVRTTSHIPDRVIIFDTSIAVITDHGTYSDPGALTVRDPSLVRYLYRSWESTWESARPFTASDSGYGSAKDELRRSIVRLLDSGMKDEVAARRLSMSISTYRRHVTELMNELGAQSRFQAGSYARRAGWMDD